MILIAPADRPQLYVPPLRGVEHPLAPEVVAALRQRGATPVNLWRVLNSLTSARNAGSRAERRTLQLRFLGALRELLKAKLVFRHNGLIALKDFAFMPRTKSQVRLPQSVRRSTHRRG
jgi:hypothetical protein